MVYVDCQVDDPVNKVTRDRRRQILISVTMRPMLKCLIIAVVMKVHLFPSSVCEQKSLFMSEMVLRIAFYTNGARQW